jgi:alcohol dehydrogenase YqhD (iron-dependent ADH family)
MAADPKPEAEEEDEIDHILAEQYHSAKKRLRSVKRLRRIFSYKDDFDLVEHRIEKSLAFFESMIIDKKLLQKQNKKKTKKQKTEDILGKNQFRTLLKTAIAYSNLSYKLMTSYWDNYMSFWKK